MENKKILSLLNKGSDIVGAGIGAGLAYAAGGPILAGLSGVLGVVVTHTLSEIANRELSNREQIRVGATAQHAISYIKLLQKSGKKIRNDGFFKEGSRSDAEEIFEGCLIVAKNSHEEKKTIYFGRLFANLCFRDDIDKNQANQLINIASQLTYSQFCWLSIFHNKDKYDLATKPFVFLKTSPSGFIMFKEISLLTEIGLYFGDTFDPVDLSFMRGEMPRRTKLEGIVLILYELMNLAEIPQSDCEELAQHISKEALDNKKF